MYIQCKLELQLLLGLKFVNIIRNGMIYAVARALKQQIATVA